MRSSEKFWDKSAEKYSKSKISNMQSYERKLAETQKLFTADMNILEFGCGTGSTAILHAPFVKHIDATDLSENMIQIGRDKAEAAGIQNITFTRGTLREFSAPEDSMDVVLGLNVLHLIDDRKATLAEVARILKPGGVFVSSTACIGGSPMRFIKWFTPLGKLLGLMPDVFVFTVSELKTELSEAGFEIDSDWSDGGAVETLFAVARKAA